MQQSLRELIAKNPNEEFRGLLLEGTLKATRRNVLVPGAVGIYTAGSGYNPAQVVRDSSTRAATEKIDHLLSSIANDTFAEFPIEKVQELVKLPIPDTSESQHIWNTEAIVGSIEKYGTFAKQNTAVVYVARDRGLDAARRETQGILSGGELGRVPSDKLILFMFRTKAKENSEPVWWPQLRFPSGRYAFAFAV